MFRRIVLLENFRSPIEGAWRMFLLQGIFLVVLGAGIMLFPRLLALIVAALFVAVGVTLVAAALKVRSLGSTYGSWRDLM